MNFLVSSEGQLTHISTIDLEVTGSQVMDSEILPYLHYTKDVDSLQAYYQRVTSVARISLLLTAIQSPRVTDKRRKTMHYIIQNTSIEASISLHSIIRHTGYQ